MTGRIKLNIDIYWAHKRKRDIDNAAKSLIDSLEGILFVNDSMIYELV